MERRNAVKTIGLSLGVLLGLNPLEIREETPIKDSEKVLFFKEKMSTTHTMKFLTVLHGYFQLENARLKLPNIIDEVERRNFRKFLTKK